MRKNHNIRHECRAYHVAGAVGVLICLMAVATGVLDWLTPLMGDDLSKWHRLGGEGFAHPDRSTLSFMAGHFMGSNGRLMDMLGPVVAAWLPHWLMSLLMAGMGGVYFYSLAVASRLNGKAYAPLCMMLLGIALGILPWWDYMWLRVCQFNYMWGSAFCLLTVVFLLNPIKKESRGSFWVMPLMCVVGFMAASSHEQNAVALSAGVIVWLFVKRHGLRLKYLQKLLLASVFVGSVLPFASPNFWNRSSESVPYFTVMEILTTTLPLVCVLVVTLAVMCVSRKGRGMLRDLTGKGLVIYVVMAAAAGGVAVLSGVPGRTGWLAESASLVALAWIVREFDFGAMRKVSYVGSWLAVAFIMGHYSISIMSQYKANKEYGRMVEEVRTSKDGVVYGDFTPRKDFPDICLDRIKGVPDNDDSHLCRVLSSALRHDGVPVVILPEALRGRLDSFEDSISAGDVSVYDVAPRHMESVHTTEGFPLMVENSHGQMMLVTHVTTSNGRDVWVVQPLAIDKGDRLVP